MHPVLFQLGPLPVHTFGVLMGLGFLVGILYSMRQARKWGLGPDDIFNLSFWIMVSGVGGARLFYILVDMVQKGANSEFIEHPANLLKIWEGGLVWYGGMICAIPVVFFYTWRFRMPALRVADVLAPATFIGLAVGRFGCLMAGDDFGRPTKVWWAVTFHNPDALVYPSSLIGQPLHPTQLYMAAKSFFVGLLCHLVLKHWKKFDGQVFCVALLVYPVLRAIVEIYRGDTKRGIFPGTGGALTTSQGIGVLVFALGVVSWIALSKRRPTFVINPPADPATP